MVRRFTSALLLVLATSALRGAENAELAALRAKAERGNAIAQYNLGLAHAQGRGTPVDAIEAYAWLSLAAESGGTGRALETVVDLLNPDQLQAGRARLEELRRSVTPQRPAVPAATAPAPIPTRPESGASATSETQLREAQASLAAQSAELARKRVEAETLRLELSKAQAELAAAHAKLQAPPPPTPTQPATSPELESLRSQFAALTADRDRRTAELATVTQRLRALQEDHEKTRADVVRLAEEHAAAQTAAGALRRERDDVIAQLRSAERELATLREQASSRPDLTPRLRELEQQNAAFTQRLFDADSAQRAADEKLAAALQTKSELTQARDALAAQLTSAQRDLATFRDQASSRPDLTPRLRELEQQNSTLSQRLTEADAALRRAEEKLAAALQTNSTLTQERDTLSERVAELTTQLNATRAEPASAPTPSAASIPPIASVAPTSVTPATIDASSIPAPAISSPAPAVVTPPLHQPTRPGAALSATRPPALATTRVSPPPAPRTHTVTAGDTLSAISLRYYGTAHRWRDILAANRDLIRDERTLVTGRTLRIP